MGPSAASVETSQQVRPVIGPRQTKRRARGHDSVFDTGGGEGGDHRVVAGIGDLSRPTQRPAARAERPGSQTRRPYRDAGRVGVTNDIDQVVQPSSRDGTGRPPGPQGNGVDRVFSPGVHHGPDVKAGLGVDRAAGATQRWPARRLLTARRAPRR